jgi:hypothetical protein
MSDLFIDFPEDIRIELLTFHQEHLMKTGFQLTEMQTIAMWAPQVLSKMREELKILRDDFEFHKKLV